MGEDSFYQTKHVNYFGSTKPIVLQNHNGPCPLIAICNVLSLTNTLDLSSYSPSVSQNTLLQLVGGRLMNPIMNENYNWETFSEISDLTLKLATGIDVNVHFRRINDFEHTAESAIFDLLDIPLYHGWLVDPQDRETSEALGSESYNTLMVELAHLEALLEIENASEKTNEEVTVDIVAEKAASLVLSSPCASSDQSFGKSPREEENTVADSVAAVTASTSVPSPPVSSSQPSGKSPLNKEDTVDTVAATTASLGVPAPRVSSGQSFCKSPQKEKKWHSTFKENLCAFTGNPLFPFGDGLEDDGLSKIISHLLDIRETNEPVTPSEKLKEVVADSRVVVFDDSNALGSDHVKKTGSDSISRESETESHTSEESDSTLEFVEPGHIDCEERRVSPGLLASTADSDSLIHKVDEPESDTANVDGNERICEGEKRSKGKLSIRQGELVKNFMNDSASQLTVYGLSCLHEELVENKLCVFFRNNHFSTMLKYNGELYILVTDQGYLNQPDLVWEKLIEVNGNTLYVTGEFKEFKFVDHSRSSWVEPKALATTSVKESEFVTGEFEESDPDDPSWYQKEFNEMIDTKDYPTVSKDESQKISSDDEDLQLSMVLQQIEYENEPSGLS